MVLQTWINRYRQNQSDRDSVRTEWAASAKLLTVMAKGYFDAKLIMFDRVELSLLPEAFLERESPLFSAFVCNRNLMQFMSEAAEFLSERLCVNYMYDYLNTIGLRKAERYLLCYLTARAIEDVCGLDPIAMIRNAKWHSMAYD